MDNDNTDRIMYKDIEFERNLKNVIAEDLKMLEIFHNLSDFFMLDYYTYDGHTLLPQSWFFTARCGKDLFLKQLCSMLCNDRENKLPLLNVMPLSLICFIKLIENRLKARKRSSSAARELQVSCKEQLRYLKPKKMIEINALLPFVDKIIAEQNITHIVDIGSGIGHASRFIAKQNPNCSILRIEAQSSLIGKAEIIDKKFMTSEEHANIVSSVKLLALDENIENSFHSILKEIDENNETCNFTDPQSRILLLGLHPCGNLGSFMLKLFKESDLCRSVIVVSCCYLFIDAEEDQTGGFPLTKFLPSNGVSKLSGQLKEQACHNAEFYLNRLLGFLEQPEQLLVQNWRSIADVFIRKREPEYSRKCFKFKRRSNGENIVSFINKNLSLHQMRLLDREEIQEATQLAVVDQWKTWAYYLVYIIKLSLGVVGESLILHDRLLYLIEGNISAGFEVVFNPMESPRNTAIVASKS